MLLKFESLLIENKVLHYKYVLLKEGIMSVINDFAPKVVKRKFFILDAHKVEGSIW